MWVWYYYLKRWFVWAYQAAGDFVYNAVEQRVLIRWAYTKIVLRQDRECAELSHAKAMERERIERWEAKTFTPWELEHSVTVQRKVDCEYTLFNYDFMLRTIKLLRRHEFELRQYVERYVHVRLNERPICRVQERLLPVEIKELLSRSDAQAYDVPIEDLQQKYRLQDAP